EGSVCGRSCAADPAGRVCGLGEPERRLGRPRRNSAARGRYLLTRGAASRNDGSTPVLTNEPPRAFNVHCYNKMRGADVKGNPDLAAAVLEVRLNGQTHSLRWPRGQSLVDALLEAGLNPPFSCKSGLCAACACRVISGEVAMDHNEILTEEDLADGFI